MTPGGSIYRAAERRLLDAIRAGGVCDFTDGAEISADEIPSWGPERTIRATLLRRLLSSEVAAYAENGVRLRGAAVEGDLDLQGMEVLPLELRQCRLATVHANQATFTGDAGFDGATLTGDAGFNGATFTDDVRFSGATFTGNAWFNGATFTGNAWFNGATFTDDARFTGATFTGHAWFNGAIANAYHFTLAQFHTTDPGPWAARQVTLTGAVFHVRARLAVAATANCDCRRLQTREGVHLLVRGGAVDLEDAEFLRRSILMHSRFWPAVPERDNPGERPEGFDKLTPAERVQWTAKERAFQLAQQLADEFGPHKTTRTRVASLRRANAGDLVLSGVGLEDCAFAGAHGLDKLRIDATCSFQRPPAWPSRTWRLFTVRQVIFEEAQWRQLHTRGWAPTSTTSSANTELDDPVPTALEIAGIYRDLRKGLEDAKDEPGAADFYYGEMEMRRLAARRSRHQRNTNSGRATGRRPSWTERRLLDAYWAVSGYGLRAWRAVTALTILLIGCAALFTLPVFAHLPAVPQHVSSVDLQTGCCATRRELSQVASPTPAPRSPSGRR
jgi:Pentapeptide repeats (9 copies)